MTSLEREGGAVEGQGGTRGRVSPFFLYYGYGELSLIYLRLIKRPGSVPHYLALPPPFLLFLMIHCSLCPEGFPLSSVQLILIPHSLFFSFSSSSRSLSSPSHHSSLFLLLSLLLPFLNRSIIIGNDTDLVSSMKGILENIFSLLKSLQPHQHK